MSRRIKPDPGPSQAERDQALANIETRYDFREKRDAVAEGDDEFTVLAFVGAYQHALAHEYLAWSANGGYRHGIREDLPDFEQQRFGAKLYKSAAEVLLFAVKWRLDARDAAAGRQPRFARDQRYRRLGAPPAQTFGVDGAMFNVDAAVAALADDREMVDPADERMTNAQRNAREQELRDQAARETR